jgi:hypothetical protein
LKKYGSFFKIEESMSQISIQTEKFYKKSCIFLNEINQQYISFIYKRWTPPFFFRVHCIFFTVLFFIRLFFFYFFHTDIFLMVIFYNGRFVETIIFLTAIKVHYYFASFNKKNCNPWTVYTVLHQVRLKLISSMKLEKAVNVNMSFFCLWRCKK